MYSAAHYRAVQHYEGSADSTGQCGIVQPTAEKYGQFRALKGSAAYRTAVRTVRDSAGQCRIMQLTAGKYGQCNGQCKA